MKLLLITAVTCLTALTLVSTARAVPPLTWEAGYPKTGPTVGGIVVKGSLNLAPGTTTTGGCLISAVPVGGGTVHTKAFTIAANQSGLIPWGEEEITGLTSNQQYNVTVQITVQTGSTIFTLATDPKVATAK